MAFKTFAPGVLTSSDVNTFLMKQAVITCTAATRPASPNEGMLIYETDTDTFGWYNGTSWFDLSALPIPINPQTGTTYTLVLADRGKLITASNASPITLTIPTNTTAAFPIGTQIGVIQTGAGQVTFAPASGVTLASYNSALKIVGNGGLAVCIKTATNTWQLSGALVP